MACQTLIDAASLQQRLLSEELVLLDCRFNLMQPDAGAQAYAAGHLPGARYAHLEQDLSGPVTPASGRHPLPDPARLARRLGSWGIDATTPVVVYDDMGGAMAARAWWLLRWLGHERVALLDGGLAGWEAAGGLLTKDLPEVTPRTFTPHPDPSALVSSGQLMTELDQSRSVLVDARAGERFRGEQEPIDPVAGHIPGALNRPLGENLSDGFFKPATTLRREWQALLAGRPGSQLVAMCGSGVTACHHLLALEHAGIAGARLYAGSWSEWIRDPQRPVAKGEGP